MLARMTTIPHRRVLARAAISAVLGAAASLGGTAGTAHALPRDPCEDVRNQQRVHETLAQQWWDLAQLMQGLGSPQLYLQFHAQYEVETAIARNADRNLIRLGCG
jgi:hypothetical protein